MNYGFHLLVYFAVYGLVAVSLGLVVGYRGLLSFAHAMFFSVGGYAYAIVTCRAGLGFPVAAVAGCLAAAALSVIVAFSAWRLDRDTFMVATIAFQIISFAVLENWTAPSQPPATLRNLTNGPLGLSVPPGTRFVLTGQHVIDAAVLTLLVVAPLMFLFYRLVSSPWGTALKALRDDEDAARGLGIRSRLLTAHALALSAILCGMAGSLYVAYVEYIDPSSASLNLSILFLSMVLIGGSGTVRASFVGAAVLIALPEVLSFIRLPEAVSANLRMIIYGALLIVIMRVRPQGIAGEYRVGWGE